MPNFPSVDCTQPVHAVVARYPASESVFRHHGVDVARSGALSVEDAARVAGADRAMLCEVLRAAALVR